MSLSDDLKEKFKEIVGGDFYNVLDTAAQTYSIVSGAYGAYVAGKSVLTSLGILESPANPFEIIQKQLTKIQETLDKILGAIEKARKEAAQIGAGIERTLIYSDSSDVKSAAFDAYWFLKEPSQQNEHNFLEHQSTAQDAINHFKDNTYYWLRIHLSELDYSDPWSGTLTPPVITQDGGDWVLDYLLTLPAYTVALANWLIVILASDEGFQKAHLWAGTELNDHIIFLNNKLEEILQNFQPIRPPNPVELSYLIYAFDNSLFLWPDELPLMGGKALPPGRIVAVLACGLLPGGMWRLSEYVCGVVEKFTGRHQVEGYPIAELTEGKDYLSIEGSFYMVSDGSPESLFYPTGAGATVTVTKPEQYQTFYDRFLLRHTLRTWSNGRVLARDLGLRRVREILCQLCALRGIAPPGLPPEWYQYFDFSMRYLYSNVPDSLKKGSGVGSSISMRKLGEMMGMSSPITLRRMMLADFN